MSEEESSVDDLLREHIMPTREVAEAENEFPGEVELISVGRYGARLEVGREILEFQLTPTAEGEKFTVMQKGRNPEEMHQWLHKLAWHRAAKAMLAVRRGHAEFNLRRKARAGT